MKIDGLKLKKIRETKGYTLRELSDLTGISPSTLVKWEIVPSANPFPSKLQIITAKLGISIEEIAMEEIDSSSLDFFTLNAPRDFLKCARNELRPDNAKTEYGLLGLIQYKLDARSTGDPDSMYLHYNQKNRCYEGESNTAKLFKKIYGKVEERSDTIFNCWSFFKMFKDARTKQFSKMWLDENNLPVFDGIIDLEGKGDLAALFKGYEDLLGLLNEFADLHHCLANMMPAPRGYNGTDFYDGKGNCKRDNDMPDLYYQRAREEFPHHYQWINDHIEEYCLKFFLDFRSPWVDGEANQALDLSDNNALAKYKSAILNVIQCLYKRAIELYQRTSVL